MSMPKEATSKVASISGRDMENKQSNQSDSDVVDDEPTNNRRQECASTMLGLSNADDNQDSPFVASLPIAIDFDFDKFSRPPPTAYDLLNIKGILEAHHDPAITHRGMFGITEECPLCQEWLDEMYKKFGYIQHVNHKDAAKAFQFLTISYKQLLKSLQDGNKKEATTTTAAPSCNLKNEDKAATTVAVSEIATEAKKNIEEEEATAANTASHCSLRPPSCANKEGAATANANAAATTTTTTPTVSEAATGTKKDAEEEEDIATIAASHNHNLRSTTVTTTATNVPKAATGTQKNADEEEDIATIAAPHNPNLRSTTVTTTATTVPKAATGTKKNAEEEENIATIAASHNHYLRKRKAPQKQRSIPSQKKTKAALEESKRMSMISSIHPKECPAPVVLENNRNEKVPNNTVEDYFGVWANSDSAEEEHAPPTTPCAAAAAAAVVSPSIASRRSEESPVATGDAGKDNFGNAEREKIIVETVDEKREEEEENAPPTKYADADAAAAATNSSPSVSSLPSEDPTLQGATTQMKKKGGRRSVHSHPKTVNQVKDEVVVKKCGHATKVIKELQYCSTWEHQQDRDEKPKSQHFMLTYDELVPKPTKSKLSRYRRPEGYLFNFLVPEGVNLTDFGTKLANIGKDMASGNAEGIHWKCTGDPDEYCKFVFGDENESKVKPKANQDEPTETKENYNDMFCEL